MQGPIDPSRSSSRRRTPDSLEDGLDRLVSAGRQLVDGVSGARPGSRRRPGAAGSGLPRLGDLGRWVEERLDGLLDDDDDDWREPWQQPRPSLRSDKTSTDISRRQPSERQLSERQPFERKPSERKPSERNPSERQPLQAISRRRSPEPDRASQGSFSDEWPGDETFTLPRWQRDPRSRAADSPSPSSRRSNGPDSAAPAGAIRPLPRSSRRRPD